MIGFDVIVRDFVVGTRYYEDVNGVRFEFVVSEAPWVVDNQVFWKAIKYGGGETDFLITKGLEHYGPRLYWNG